MDEDVQPCTDCPDESYAVAADEDTTPDLDDPRGTDVTRWGPQLIAPYEAPTGDKRRFAAGALTNRDLPVPMKWQRADSQGHQQSVVVGTLDEVEQREDGVYGSGLLFDPDPAQLPRLAEDVNEVRHLSGQGVLGLSVDLDDMEFHAIEDEATGELAAGDPNSRPEIEVTRGRISAVTLVPIPAFAESRALELSKVPAEQYAAGRAALTASVNADLLHLPVALDVAEWDAVTSVNDLTQWAHGSTETYAQAFLWHDGSTGRFPVASVVDGSLAVVPAAVDQARGYLSRAALPAADLAVMADILDQLDARVAQAALEDLDGADGLDDDDVSTFGARFDKLKAKLAGQGVSDPGAVAATIGRTKYGKKGFNKLRAGVAASKVKPLHGARTASALASMVAAAISGDWSGLEETMQSLVAAAGRFVPQAYQAVNFQNPKLDRPTPLTVEGNRIFGHVATWGTCHVGFAGCVKAPKSRSSYSYFHTAAAPLDSGEVLPVGKLTVGGGHADTAFGHRAAAEHYDDASTAVALVRAGEDKFGIWYSGEIRPDADPAAVQQLIESPISGDWRQIGGHLEMIAAHGVNSGGFPIPRVSLSASAGEGVHLEELAEREIMTLVAAAVLPVHATSTTDAAQDLRSIALDAARQVLAEQATYARKQKAAALLATMGDSDADDRGGKPDGDADDKKKRRMAAAKAFKQDDNDEMADTIIPRDAKAKRRAAVLAALGKGK